MAEKNKNLRIKSEFKRIALFFQELDEKKRDLVIPLIQNAAFMKVTLEDLQEIIIRDGVTEEYQNGANQHGIKQSATLQSYNALIKNYSSVIRSLAQYLPHTSFTPYWVKLRQGEKEEDPKEREERLAKDREHFIEQLDKIRAID